MDVNRTCSTKGLLFVSGERRIKEAGEAFETMGALNGTTPTTHRRGKVSRADRGLAKLTSMLTRRCNGLLLIMYS